MKPHCNETHVEIVGLRHMGNCNGITLPGFTEFVTNIVVAMQLSAEMDRVSLKRDGDLKDESNSAVVKSRAGNARLIQHMPEGSKASSMCGQLLSENEFFA